MKRIEYSEEKNEELKKKRRVSFKDVEKAIDSEGLLDKIKHPNIQKYKHQKLLIIKIKNYVYFVPYVEDKEKYFLKTIIPSRKYTKKYLNKK